MGDRPFTSPADANRHNPQAWTDMRLYDTAFHDATPTLLLLTDDGRRARCQLDPAEAFRLVKSLVGYLGHLYRVDSEQEAS